MSTPLPFLQRHPKTPPLLPLPFHHHHHPSFLRANLPLAFPTPRPTACNAAAATADNSLTPVDVEMVRGRDGVWSARDPTVVVLWDLDNKPPRGPPFPAASSLRAAASLLGSVVSISAFANRHAFSHLPSWVSSQRRDRRALDHAERRGLVTPPVPYSCAVCGRRFPTRPDLARHFRQLHQREREKKLSRLRSLKGKKRQRFRERYISNNAKYDEAASELLTPKVGYGLASELRRAGVHVRTVSDKPQAADAALKRQVLHSVACGVDWVVLVSDDSDFAETVHKARAAELRTVVVGDGRRALGKVADIWLPWDRVENGEVDEEMLRIGPQRAEYGLGQEFGNAVADEQEEFMVDWDASDLDDVVDDVVVKRTGLFGSRMSVFSDEDIVDGMLSVGFNGDDLFCSGGRDEDGYL